MGFNSGFKGLNIWVIENWSGVAHQISLRSLLSDLNINIINITSTDKIHQSSGGPSMRIRNERYLSNVNVSTYFCL